MRENFTHSIYDFFLEEMTNQTGRGEGESERLVGGKLK